MLINAALHTPLWCNKDDDGDNDDDDDDDIVK